MKQPRGFCWIRAALLILASLFMSVSAMAHNSEKAVHPELSEQQMYIPCAECHKEATPEIEKQWYDSSHGIAMIKCYQCHGTFETFKAVPAKEVCAVCHANQLEKCSKDGVCWDCHVPHTFKAKK